MNSQSLKIFFLDFSQQRFDQDVLKKLADSLCFEEKKHLDHISDSQRRREYVLGHTLLHLALASVHKDFFANNNVLVYRDSLLEIEGIDQEKISFNISHTKNRVAVAVSDGSRVGIDIEHSSSLRNVGKLVQRYFREEEWRLLQDLESNQQRYEFLKLWTLKESHIKAQKKSIGSFGLKTQFTACRDFKAAEEAWFSAHFESKGLHLALTSDSKLPEKLSLYACDRQFSQLRKMEFVGHLYRVTA